MTSYNCSYQSFSKFLSYLFRHIWNSVNNKFEGNLIRKRLFYQINPSGCWYKYRIVYKQQSFKNAMHKNDPLQHSFHIF